MTHIKMTVNGDVVMDDDTGRWKTTPPTAVQHLLKPGKRPEPYMQAALGALLEATILDCPTQIDAETYEDGWSVTVTHKQRVGAKR